MFLRFKFYITTLSNLNTNPGDLNQLRYPNSVAWKKINRIPQIPEIDHLCRFGFRACLEIETPVCKHSMSCEARRGERCKGCVHH
jgi:hypothetical protein